MKTFAILILSTLLFGCNSDTNMASDNTPVTISLLATSQRKYNNAILHNVGGQVLEIDKGKCVITFILISRGIRESIGEADFDSKLGKTAFVTPAVDIKGKSYIELYINGLKETRTSNSYRAEPTLDFISYEFETPRSFGTSVTYRSVTLSKPAILCEYIIRHKEGAGVSIDDSDNVDSMIERSKQGDVSFLVIKASPSN